MAKSNLYKGNKVEEPYILCGWRERKTIQRVYLVGKGQLYGIWMLINVFGCHLKKKVGL